MQRVLASLWLKDFMDYQTYENGTVEIEMKRVSFGVRFIAENFTEGILNVQISEAPLLSIIYPSTSVEGIFTFNNSLEFGHSPYGNIWMRDDYSETIPVVITWVKEDGNSMPVANRNITFKRNKLTTITVKINDAGVENGVNISTENEDIQPGDNIVIDANGSGEGNVDPTVQ